MARHFVYIYLLRPHISEIKNKAIVSHLRVAVSLFQSESQPETMHYVGRQYDLPSCTNSKDRVAYDALTVLPLTAL